MADSSKTVASEGEHTLIRIAGQLEIPSGTVLVRQGGRDGEIVITPIAARTERHEAWLAFLDELSARPTDTEFMKERPMNRIPAEKYHLADD